MKVDITYNNWKQNNIVLLCFKVIDFSGASRNNRQRYMSIQVFGNAFLHIIVSVLIFQRGECKTDTIRYLYNNKSLLQSGQYDKQTYPP